MKYRKAFTGGGVENRWFLILPALALGIGCEPKPDVTSSADPELGQSPQATTAGEQTGEAASATTETTEVANVATTEPQAAELAPAPSAADPPQQNPSVVGSPRSPTKENAATAPAPATVRRGPAAKGEGFNVWLEGKSEYALNEPASLTIVLTAEAPFKCNDQYPYRFTVASAPGLQASESVVRGMNVDKERSTMTVPFTPIQKGSHTLSGELSFSVCTDDKCLIEKETLTFPVDVGGS